MSDNKKEPSDEAKMLAARMFGPYLNNENDLPEYEQLRHIEKLEDENLDLSRKLLTHLRAGVELSRFSMVVSVMSGLTFGVGLFNENQLVVWLSLGAICTNFLMHTVYSESLKGKP